jgi:hypothetical protein
MRFFHIYPQNRRSYSQVIRAEIVEVFGVPVSAETLRSIFGKLRKSIFCETKGVEEEGETPCDEPLPVMSQQFALWRHGTGRVGQEWPTYWGKTGIPACPLMRQWP